MAKEKGSQSTDHHLFIMTPEARKKKTAAKIHIYAEYMAFG